MSQTQTTSSPESFRWLFTAHYADGSTIQQTQEDRSVTGKGSAFTDVLAKTGLIAFELKHVNGQEQALVDLTTGAFVVNGTPINIHDQYLEPQHHELRLVYFRETRFQPVVGADGDMQGAKHYVNRYFIGWQTTTKLGKNVQHLLAVG